MEPTGKILDITPDEYHRDPLGPSLSSSIAKLLVDRSPLHAWAAHPLLGGIRRETTPAMDAGTLVHRLVLGKGADVVEIEADSYRTNVAKDLRDAALAAGKIPVLSEKLAEARETARYISDNLAAHGIHFTGASEVAVTWQQRVFCSDATITCKAMLDHVFWDDGVIYDVKKISSAHPDQCVRSLSSYAYDIQHAAYTSALRAVRPDLAGREDFVFLFVEDEPPYAVTPVRLDGQFRALGEARWDRATKLWHECLSADSWPGYTTGIVNVSPPAWAMSREAL